MEDSTSQGDSVTDELESSHEELANDREVHDEPVIEDGVHDSVDSESDEPDTFDRAYVEKLRQENGKYRQRAQRADELAHRLHRALVEATGRLADPTDLPFSEDHLGDTESLTSAIDELLTTKPHLAKRMISGEIGQGATASGSSVDLTALLRGRR